MDVEHRRALNGRGLAVEHDGDGDGDGDDDDDNDDGAGATALRPVGVGGDGGFGGDRACVPRAERHNDAMAGTSLDTLRDVEPLLRRRLTVAVLGAHPQPQRPAHFVPAWLHARGHRILPVNPRFVGQSLFGEPVRARLDELTEPVDVVDVFRRSEDVPAHLDEILAMRPRPAVVWLQSGIDHPETCAALRDVGVDTVADRCMLADGRALGL